MIVSGNTEFPNNVITLAATRARTYLDPDEADAAKKVKVFMRPLRTSDPQQCVGIFPAIKRPDETTREMPGIETTLKRYSIIMQTFTVDTDEEACISIHSILSNRLWRMWFHDSPLHIGLTALEVMADNTIERFQRRGIELQRYLSNEIDGSYMQTSWIECWFDTETVET